jgi:uncharacterized protein
MLGQMGDSAHDPEHVYRVLNIARKIAQSETGVNREVLGIACLLHDIGRAAQFADASIDHAQEGARMARNWLLAQGRAADFADAVASCIAAHRYRSSNPPQSIEAKILFDADKVDVCGAMGWARSLLYSGVVGEPLYTLNADGGPSDGSGDAPPSMLHEYRFNLEKLYDRFYTAQGAALGRARQGAARGIYKALLFEIREAYEQTTDSKATESLPEQEGVMLRTEWPEAEAYMLMQMGDREGGRRPTSDSDSIESPSVPGDCQRQLTGDTAHDPEHVYRVLHIALKIAASEPGVDRAVLGVACLLHDIGRAAQYADAAIDHAAEGARMARAWLLQQGRSADFADAVAACIAAHRYRSSHPPQSIEAKILFDADKVDACGTMGWVRGLLYKGVVGEPLYTLNPDGTPCDGSGDAPPSMLQEYRFKLEKLYDRFYTAQGAALGRARQAAARELYQALLAEIQDSYA